MCVHAAYVYKYYAHIVYVHMHTIYYIYEMIRALLVTKSSATAAGVLVFAERRYAGGRLMDQSLIVICLVMAVASGVRTTGGRTARCCRRCLFV